MIHVNVQGDSVVWKKKKSVCMLLVLILSRIEEPSIQEESL